MDKELEQIPDTTTKQDNSSAMGDTPVSDVSRRRFTRGAVVTGAVLVSLGNRAAWGVSPHNPVCVSDATWLSYTNASSSMSPGTITQMEALEHELKKPGMMLEKGVDNRCAVQCFNGSGSNPNDLKNCP